MLQSTTLRFAVASLVPFLILGAYLTSTVRGAIEERTTAVYGSMSDVLFRMAADVVFRPEDFGSGRPLSDDRAAVVDGLIDRAASASSGVRVRIFDREGRVVYARAGSRETTLDFGRKQFDVARDGSPAARFLRDRRTVGPAGPSKSDVLEVYLPVRFEGDDHVYGVIVASGLDGATIGSIDADVRRIRASLAAGLAGLWLALFPIVLSVSRRLRRTAATNRHQALHDSLTGLPNRDLLRDRLGHALQRAERTGTDVGLLLIDLDHFKDVNDTLGHGRGDELLVFVSQRLAHSLRPGDTVARLGGDEFAVVVDALPGEQELVRVAGRVADALAQPLVVEGVEVAIQASIGGVIAPTHGVDGEELLRHADIAMYAAKAAGTGLVLYAPELDAHSPSQLALTAEFRRALEADDQLVLHYQAVAAPATGAIVAVEALVRWRHPTRGLLSPADFIPVAEQSGLVRGLSAKVLELALAQQRRWLDLGVDLAMSVNLSASDLRCPELVGAVEAALARHGILPSRLELEVTETAILANPDAAVATVDAIRRLGVAVALDDFGTGYSSLTFLKRLRPDRLKIDRSFVDTMTHDATDRKIVRSLIDLAHSLHIGVTAEGVETSDHWDVLRDLDCDLVQGYFIGRPVEPAALLASVRSRVPIGAAAEG